ncbi:MAG: hypothetical protein HDT44_02235 [Ruminococcaceae bacterium]|nr:hypothetical protein [Oscillospiraceae bacterium]
MRFKKIISSILLCTVLAGCSNSSETHEIPLEQSNCQISTVRTGTQRQGIKGYGNNFECTTSGSYFMCDIGTKTWLLYVDHTSDTIIKLCGRPDCTHTDSDCNAYFDSCMNICYYDGFLYTFNMDSKNVIRMNLDGTERITVYNVAKWFADNKYQNIVNPKIINGVLFFMLGKLDDNGAITYDNVYYKLDNSMDEPKIDVFWEIFIMADGENFMSVVDYDVENELYTYGLWEPEKGVVDELFKTDDLNAYGYVGTKARYYVENDIIIEDSYTEGKKELINIGKKGNYQLACFPDCIVAYEYLSDEDFVQGMTLDDVTLRFYDWNYNDLGSVKIDYEFDQAITGFICGETPNRIILANNIDYLPRYYINKSDFGTGNIEIHALNVPDFGEE